MRSTIDFSAQFGGRDAAKIVLPHFKALKSAASSVSIGELGFKELSFVLRVDGEVNQYGLSGACNVEIGEDADHLSVDVGITNSDRTQLKEVISNAILASPAKIRATKVVAIARLDFESLHDVLYELCRHYAANLQ